MNFVDARDNASAAATSRLEVRGAFRADRLSGAPLREFGLFGGDATSSPNSGMLINHVIHPRVDLAPGELLERRLILSFGQVASDRDELGAFGENLPVVAIKGVSALDGAALMAGGVGSVGELARLDGTLHFPAIPAVHLREFLEKALMVRRFQPLSSLRSLAGLPIQDVLGMTPAEIVSSSWATLDEAAARDARDSLVSLQVALDVEALRRILVSELFGGDVP
jgi:hypothetical protein